MPLLIRKFSRAKWNIDTIDTNDDISSDAVTSCLRTQSNTLSVWEVENEDSINDALLAIISGQDKLEAIDIIKLDPEILRENRIDILETDGKVVVESLIKQHRDLSYLTFAKIGTIKDIVIDLIKKERWKRITKATQVAILKEALKKGLFDSDKLKDGVKKEIVDRVD